MIDKGQWWEFGQDTGVTPLLLTRSAMGFLMSTESQDLADFFREVCIMKEDYISAVLVRACLVY